MVAPEADSAHYRLTKVRHVLVVANRLFFDGNVLYLVSRDAGLGRDECYLTVRFVTALMHLSVLQGLNALAARGELTPVAHQILLDSIVRRLSELLMAQPLDYLAILMCWSEVTNATAVLTVRQHVLRVSLSQIFIR